MRIKLGFFKYKLQPDSLQVMIMVEEMAEKPIYEINESLQDQLIYMFAMFKCAGFRLGWITFKMLLNADVVANVLQAYQEASQEKEKSPDPEHKKPVSLEKVSAHEMLYHYSITSGLDPSRILQLDQVHLEAISKAHERLTRETWEQSRLMAFCSIAPHLEGKQKLENWLPFSWEKNTSKAPLMSPEKYNQLKQKAEQHGIKHKGTFRT